MAAGFSLDMAVLERAHGVDAVELALRSAGGATGPAPAGAPRAAGRRRPAAGRPAAGDAGPGDRPAARHRAAARRRTADVEVVAVSGYEPGDRLDGWYDALLATVSAARPGHRDGRPRRRRTCCPDLPEVGVPHDGAEVCAVLARLAAGSSGPGSLTAVLG